MVGALGLVRELKPPTRKLILPKWLKCCAPSVDTFYLPRRLGGRTPRALGDLDAPGPQRVGREPFVLLKKPSV